MEPEVVTRSMRLFAEEVMPQFRTWRGGSRYSDFGWCHPYAW